MRIRFQADADLDERIVRGLKRRQRAVDFRTAAESGLIGVPDPGVLRIAAELDRILVSHDERTMPRHFGDFLAIHSTPGVLVIPQRTSLAVGIEELLTIWEASEAEEWRDRLVWIPL